MISEFIPEEITLARFWEIIYALGHGTAFGRLRRTKPSDTLEKPPTWRHSICETVLIAACARSFGN